MAMKKSQIDDILKQLYDNKDVKKGYTHYCTYLLGKCMRMFEYENLPKNLFRKEIEKSLLVYGIVGITKVPSIGFLSMSGSESGTTDYHDIFKNFIGNTPLRTVTYEIGKGGIVGYNNSLKSPLFEVIKRYARQLADIDSTYAMSLVNMRLPFINVADDDETAQSIEKTMSSIELGNYKTVVNATVFKNIQQLEFYAKVQGSLKELIESRRFVMQNFYNDIGVKMASDKKERMIETEVDSNNQMLLVSLSDMLENRQKMVEDLNKMYSLNVTVKLSNEFDVEIVESDEKTIETAETANTESEVLKND